MDPFAKDCGCITHDGPHWLDMDEFDHERNRELLRRMNDRLAAGEYLAAHLAGLAFAGAEKRRLDALVAEMRRRGIDQIPPEVRERVRRSRGEYVEHSRAKLDREKHERATRAGARLTEAATEYESATPERRAALRDEMAELQQTIAAARATPAPTGEGES